MKLFKYQKRHALRLISILKTRRGALDLSATGTGKTVCACFVAKELKKPLTVISPLAAIPGWERTAHEMKVKLSIVNYESVKKEKGFLETSGFEFIGEPRIEKNSLVVYDEAHRCKNHETDNSKGMRYISSKGYKILALSATMAAHAEKLRPWNEAFNFANTESFFDFMTRCGYSFHKSGHEVEWLPSENSSVLTRRIIEPFASGMTHKDAAAMFKGNFVFVETIKTKSDAVLKKAYEDYYKAKREPDRKVPGDHLTRMLRARQASEIVKVDYIVNNTEELIEEGNSVFIACNYNETLDALARALKKYNPTEIRGNQKSKEREKERLRFQHNKTFVCLANIASGAESLDLHDLYGRPRHSIILPGPNAEQVRQALGRIHRAGAKSPPIQKILFSDIPVEKRIAEIVRRKLSVLDTLHDNELDTIQGLGQI